MPELPEVETVRRGLAPAFEGARVTAVRLRRADLRFPFPDRFQERLEGARVDALGRRGKYLVAALSSGESLIMHLGMSGRFTVAGRGVEAEKGAGEQMARAAFHYAAGGDPRHDHVAFDLDGPNGGCVVTYNDPRRFGFMDLVPGGDLEVCRHFAGMGPEPLSAAFSDAYFADRLRGGGSPIKTALLDQRVVAGVGNIYACEALYRAGVSPRRRAGTVPGARSRRLRMAIVDVLEEAIVAGGSSLRDFAATDGGLGYFQHAFAVYDRAGEPCRRCGGVITRITQSGRSTFFCGGCQR
ncbi:MAG: bifunctional DNA-formamidopyrimidine glycosylase/DNA-(apurinic or apyrimidinic site) lyase [Pseudomonadota bacterium]